MDPLETTDWTINGQGANNVSFSMGATQLDGQQNIPPGEDLEDKGAETQGCNEKLCPKEDLLFHRNILLELTITKLAGAYELTRKNKDEECRALLKVRLQRANQEAVDIKGWTGKEEDVKRTYTLLNALEEEIIRATALINLEEAQIPGKNSPSTPSGMKTPSIKARCVFKNCKSTKHFTNQCPVNLKKGKISHDIFEQCMRSKVCLRCMRDRDHWNHDRACSGSYVCKNSNKLIETDCKSCKFILPGGSPINLNKRICYHTLAGKGTGTVHPDKPRHGLKYGQENEDEDTTNGQARERDNPYATELGDPTVPIPYFSYFNKE